MEPPMVTHGNTSSTSVTNPTNPAKLMTPASTMEKMTTSTASSGMASHLPPLPPLAPSSSMSSSYHASSTTLSSASRPEETSTALCPKALAAQSPVDPNGVLSSKEPAPEPLCLQKSSLPDLSPAAITVEGNDEECRLRIANSFSHNTLRRMNTAVGSFADLRVLQSDMENTTWVRGPLAQIVALACRQLIRSMRQISLWPTFMGISVLMCVILASVFGYNQKPVRWK